MTADVLPLRPSKRIGEQCDSTCTADCGHCKGSGKPKRIDHARGEEMVPGLLVFAEFAYDATDLNRVQSRALLVTIHRGFRRLRHVRDFEAIANTFALVREYERGDLDCEFGGNDRKAVEHAAELRRDAEMRVRLLVSVLLTSEGGEQG